MCLQLHQNVKVMVQGRTELYILITEEINGRVADGNSVSDDAFSVNLHGLHNFSQTGCSSGLSQSAVFIYNSLSSVRHCTVLCLSSGITSSFPFSYRLSGPRRLIEKSYTTM